jgi:hypothetical protein
MRRVASILLLAVALAAVVVLVVDRREAVGAALAGLSWAALAGLTAIHVVTLAIRSEAWRVTLGAVEGHALPRPVVHGANAGAFVCGALLAHAAMPARIGLLRRLGGRHAPTVAQTALADVPLLVLETCGICVLLAVGALLAGLGDLWLAPAALAFGAGLLLVVRAVARRWDHKPLAQGLRVTGDCRVRGRLVAWMGGLTALTAAKVWLVLIVCGLPHGLGEVSLVVASLGVFGLLPLGPSASPGATLATLGSASVGGALAAGLVISATTFLAVAVYGLILLALPLLSRVRPLPGYAPAIGQG